MSDILKKILNILTFTDLSIRKKFLLFSLGSLFWLIVISAIGLITMFDMSAKSKMIVDVIEPQEKTINIVLRKLRGASISAHKIALYKNMESVNNNYLNGKTRLEDSRSYLKILLTGGHINDYSRGTGQFYNEFIVVPIKDAEKRKFIEDVIVKADQLEEILTEMAEKRLSGTNVDVLIERLADYDLLTRDTVIVLNEYAISIGKELGTFTSIIKSRFNIAIVLISLAFGIAAILCGIFGMLISYALAKPIKAIIGQIKALSSGEIDLTKKLDVASKDEIGTLSNEFNKLMDTIEHVTSFKKIIEEDESIEDIYMRFGKIFIDDLDFGNCVIYEVSNSKNNMRIMYPPEAEGIELYCKRDVQLDCELCRVKRTGHMVSSEDYPNICKYYIDDVNNIHWCIPIMIGGNVGGVVQFVCGKRGVCDINDIRKKISRAKQYITDVQPVLEAKHLMKTLKESSFKDALTGLYNRRFLEESFENLVAGVLRRGTTLGLLMCDLDFFKQTNDVYGHDVGDMVLKEAASNMKKSVRASDLVIRFGGEEFLILLIDIKQGDSLGVAEKIRETIEESKVKIAGGFIQKTISIGACEFPADTQNFWEAIKFADVALYKAKEMGRNKVLKFTMDMWSEEKY